MEISVNGRIVPLGSASVSAADMSLLHGTGLFTTARVYGGKVFRLHQHIARLIESARALQINFTPAGAELAEWVDAAVQSSGLSDARLRVTVTAGDSPLVKMPRDGELPTSNVVITVSELFAYPRESYDKGITTVVSDVRYNPTDPLNGHKTTSYLTNLMCLQEARGKGALEALRFTPDGKLAEGAISNVFAVVGETLVTPPADLPVLPGIARGVVLEIARDVGLKVDEHALSLHELLEADEVFLTNSIMEVMPVVRIERRPIGKETVGGYARALLSAYRQKVEVELQVQTLYQAVEDLAGMSGMRRPWDDDDDDPTGDIDDGEYDDDDDDLDDDEIGDVDPGDDDDADGRK